MKQTAVEWLENQIMTSKYFYSLMKELNSRGTIVQPNVFEQAKKMEKEQMKYSYKQGFAYRDTWNWELDVNWDEDSTQENNQEFEQFYNETFKL